MRHRYTPEVWTEKRRLEQAAAVRRLRAEHLAEAVAVGRVRPCPRCGQTDARAFDPSVVRRGGGLPCRDCRYPLRAALRLMSVFLGVVARAAALDLERAGAATFVYFLRQDEPPHRVKIGMSRDPAARLGDLQIGSPSPLVLVGACRGGALLEAELHDALGADRSHGEWFTGSLAVGAVVDALLARAEYVVPPSTRQRPWSARLRVVKGGL